VLSVSALGLMLAVFAVQGRTNTRSNAAELGNAPCDRQPKIQLTGTEGKPNYVVYKLVLNNNDLSGKDCFRQAQRDYDLTKNIPSGWHAEFININDNPVDKLVNIDPGGSKKFEFWVRPAAGANRGTYTLSIKAKEQLSPFYSDTIYLKYTKD
jgi:hypothetical protein